MPDKNLKLDKHYDQMTRLEKRAYKRYLWNNKLWDGAVLVEAWERRSNEY